MKQTAVEVSGGQSGYVLLHRKLFDNPVWTQLSPAVLKVLIAFLLKANWKPTTWYDGTAEVEIPRGSFVTSYPKMAEFCQLSLKQTRSSFVHLERLQFAAYRRAPKWTMVTVLNYGTYQGSLTGEGAVQGTTRARRGHDEGMTRAPIEEVKNTYTPPTPSEEGDGAGAPLVLVSPDLNEQPLRQPSKRKPYRDALEQVAQAIHDRHPNAHGRRDLGVAGVEKKLEAILKHKCIPVADSESYLARVDRLHAAACASDTWSVEDGRFVKSLRNYLAPTEERYELEPPIPARKEPARLMA